ncbi:hypothetical protein J2W54_004548 [Rhodococcus fascians]|nr:hypothetical protein [Rhodococcus sp. 3258]MDR6934134.1 hypothetical protein [Rhodococcus fascians]
MNLVLASGSGAFRAFSAGSATATGRMQLMLHSLGRAR